jgi:outer membrane biosynthesis protein TonB
MKLQLSPEEFLAIPPNKFKARERHFQLKISRNTLLALIFSILLHAVFFLFRVPNVDQVNGGSVQSRPIEIRLEPQKENARQMAAAPVVPPQPELVKPPTPPKEKPKPKVITQKKQVASTSKPSTFVVPKELAKVEPQETKPIEKPLDLTPPTPAPAKAIPEAPTDMMALVKARRAERLAKGDAAEINASAIASSAGQTEEQALNERLKKNLKSGTNGIFEITSLSSRHATFAFRGWTGDYSNARLQFFEVEAKSGQDIRLQLIRRMIALIREHYQEDFTWDSHRLGRAVTLSARMQDNAGLEDFLMTEFFGPQYQAQGF